MISDCSIIHEDMVNNIKTLLPVDDTFIKTSSFFKVLGDKTRIKILWILNEGELCVCDIAYILGCSIATASHHLRMLYDADILDRQKKGKMVYYFIKDDDLKKILAQLDR